MLSKTNYRMRLWDSDLEFTYSIIDQVKEVISEIGNLLQLRHHNGIDSLFQKLLL